jgi:hypothetical protein
VTLPPGRARLHFELDEFRRDLGQALGSSLRPAILNRGGAAFDPAEFPRAKMTAT